jgi:cytochrome c553
MNTSLKTLVVALAATALTSLSFGATAEENWTKHCAKCHGADGAGKKAMKTADYTSAEVQAKFTDEQAFDATKNGIPDTKMPGYAAKGLTDEEITALVAHIRAMKK